MLRDVATLEELVSQVRGAVEPFPEIAFAFLFGSAAAGRLRKDSDIDVAVYEGSQGLAIESEREFSSEIDMQLAVERATNRNVDLLILNRAPASVCSAALLHGVPVLLRDGALYSRYFLAVTKTAMDFLESEADFRRIRERSNSLSDIDRNRIARILAFIEDELKDKPDFQAVTLSRYQQERALRRNLDRWVETLINATLDIAKIVLASEGRNVPQTYGQVLELLEATPPFDALTGRLRHLAALHNLMAHEYLDLRFRRVRRFVETDADSIAELSRITGTWLQRNHA